MLTKIFIFAFLTYSAHSMMLNVKEIENYNQFEGMFKLTDPEKNYTHAILDCQSFFKKLDFKNSDNEMLREYYITQSECKYIYEIINSCLTGHKSKCLDSEDIFNSNCNCI